MQIRVKITIKVDSSKSHFFSGDIYIAMPRVHYLISLERYSCQCKTLMGLARQITKARRF